MCGRYAFYLPPEKLKSFFGLENLLNLPPRYNCAPMQALPIVVKGRMGMARWGFRPEWAKEDNPGMAAKMINARSESVAEKPAFRESWARGRRAIVPVSGFYEWSSFNHGDDDGVKRPYYIYHPELECVGLAGLWSKVDGQVSFTILTKEADGEIADYHHRMPVILTPDQAGDWFGESAADAQDIIVQASGRAMCLHEVSGDVGKVANNAEHLIQKIA